MASVLSETFTVPDRIYVHQLNLTSADLLRKQRDREMVAIEKAKLKDIQEIKKRQKEEERKRDMEMLLSYNPWGKPGAGAPQEEHKRSKFEEKMEIPAPPPPTVDKEDNLEFFNRKFGRPGGGAPIRTDSGRLKTQLTGDAAIRFQDTQHVRLSIENQLRYKNQNRETYSKNLEQIIQEKHNQQEREKELEMKQIEEMKELYPFGRQSDNGGSLQSVPDPVFLSTRPKRRPFKKEDFDPWGQGFGNPTRDERGNIQRHKFIPTCEGGIPDVLPPETAVGLTLNIGRTGGGGAGAPIITDSGNRRTRLQNTLRNLKDQGPHIGEAVSNNGIYEPWGKPGAGAPFKREGGKMFEEKMGWSLTGHPKKRSKNAKMEYMAALQQEMEEKRQRQEDEKTMDSKGIVRIRDPQNRTIETPGIELASVIRQGVGGRPKKDPATGEIARNPLPITDVTSQSLDIRRVKSQETIQYSNELAKQAAERQKCREEQKEMERAQSEQHLHTWETFWGRPGHGAPRDPENHRKENLSSLLLQPEGTVEPYRKHYVAEVVPSKSENRYEYSTKNGKILKKEYEFRTPYPAVGD